MGQVNEFKATIHSLGEHVVDYIGRDRLQSVAIWGDEDTGSAEVAIQLVDDSWDAEAFAIEKMLEVRGLFLTELAIDYRFFDEAAPVGMRATKPAVLMTA